MIQISNLKYKSDEPYVYRFLFLFLFLFYFSQVFSQSLGINPNQQNWRKLESRSAEIIFPAKLKPFAIQTAKVLNHQMQEHRLIGEKKARIPILLHNQTLVSNGYVGLAPFRSEFFLSPPQTFRRLGSTQWGNLLALHEYRHVLQFANAKVGASKVGHWLFGEVGWASFASFSLPNWYWEGDAILSETLLSKSGRGRLPYFTLGQRSIAQAQKSYRYHKIRNGSFKDWVPDHYAWGYTLLSHLQNEKGAEVLPKVMKEAAAYDKIIYPFSRSLKANSAYTTKSLYKAAWNSAKTHWGKQIKDRPFTPHKTIKEAKDRLPTFYYYPQLNDEGELIVWKQSYQKTDEIIQLIEGKEKLIAKPGYTYDRYFHVNGDYLVWTEQSVDPRRERKQYSNVVLYHRNLKEKRYLSKKARLFSPIISHDQKAVYAIEYTQSLLCRLIKLELQTGLQTVITSFPQNTFISRLAEDKQARLYFLQQENNKLAIAYYDLKSGQSKTISPWTAHSIDDIRISGDYLYFSASFNQVDNLYRIKLEESAPIEQLSESRLGSYHPFYDSKNGALIFTEGKFNGFAIRKLQLSECLKSSIEITEPIEQTWQLQNLDEANESFLENLVEVEAESKAYKAGIGKLKLHSWPINASPSNQSISLAFNDYLRNWSARTTAGYNLNEEASYYRANLSFGKHLPVFRLSASRSFRSFERFSEQNNLIDASFVQDQIGLSINIPLSSLKGNYRYSFQPALSYDFVFLDSQFDNQSTQTALIEGSLRFSALRRTAFQNLAPKWGLQTSLNYGLNQESATEARLAMSARAFLPGLFANHSLQLSGGLLSESLRNSYQWFDNFFYPRGYNLPLNDAFYRLSMAYRLPLLYPDWGFGGITYFKRIRANFFFDYGESQLDLLDRQTVFRSLGTELSFDNVWFNWAPLTIGVRSAYRLNEVGGQAANSWQHQLFFATNF